MNAGSPPEARAVLLTLGHSDRTSEELVRLIKSAGIACVVDVRSHPWSRRHPWHGRSEMEAALEDAGVRYVWMGAELGGMRPDGYPAHQQTDLYARGLDRLLELASEAQTGILCAERDPWHCHRRYIADDVLRRGCDIRHVIDDKTVIAHQPPLI